MRQFIIAALLTVSLFACGPASGPVQAVESFTAPDPFSLSCAAGYVRSLPHYCQLLSTASIENWVISATGCNTHTLTTVPNGAKLLDTLFHFTHTSTNAIASHIINAAFYNDLTCTTAITGILSGTREYVATAADTQVSFETSHVVLPIQGGTKVVTNTTFTNKGTSAGLNIEVIGYYD